MKTSNRILNPAQYAFPAMCSDDFYFSLLERSVVCDLNRSQSQFNTRSYQPAQVYHPLLLSEFNLISRTHLLDKISQMYTSSCPTDIISLLNLLNEFYLSSLPGFSIINQPLSSGCIQDEKKKTAIIFTLLKKTLPGSSVGCNMFQSYVLL